MFPWTFLRSAPGLLLACACLAHADDTFRISGSVVNSATGEAICGGLVTLTFLSARPGTSSNSRLPNHVVTGPAGEFRFSELATGEYIIRAAKPGFTTEPQGAQEIIDIGPSRDGMVLRLAPFGKVHGRVTDTGGAAIAFAAVRLFRSEILDGRRRITESRSVTADDLGRYRCWNLPPGTYFAVTAGRGGGTQLFVGYTVAAPNSHEGFMPVYFGGGNTRASATPISLSLGQDFEANMEVVLQPVASVRGRITNLRPYQAVTVELLREERDHTSANRAAVNTATGQFELHDVGPGTYLLRATQGTGDAATRGECALRMADSDIDGVTLDLRPGVDVTGKLQQAPADQQGVRAFAAFELEPVDEPPRAGFGRPPTFAVPGNDLVIHGVFPGRYRLRFNKVGGYIASARSGDADLLHGGELVVSAGSAPAPVEITMANDGGRISGSTTEAAEEQTILLVPANGAEPETFKAILGKFDTADIAPGDYQIFLLKDANSIEYRNPEVVRSLQGGQFAHVSPGGTVEVELKEAAQ